MDLNLEKEQIGINKIICNKKEVISIQDDIIVSDTKPDVLNIINSMGNVCIYKKELLENKVKIEGCVNSYIIYLPDSNESNLRGLNSILDFSETIKLPEVKSGMQFFLNSRIIDLECKVLNGRKISVKANIEFNIKIFSNETVEAINKVNNTNNIQLLEKEFLINSLIGYGNTIVYAKDNLNVDEKNEIAEILKSEYVIQNKELKISFNKVVSKAEIFVNIMYLTEDNRKEKIEGKIPIVGFIDIPNVNEESICNINYELKNLIIKLNSPEEHSIGVEFEMNVNCIAYTKKKINIIQDLYSPTINLEFSQQQILTPSEIKKRKDEFTIKETQSAIELAEVNFIDIDKTYNLIDTKISKDRINYTGEIVLNCIFSKINTINSKKIKIPFNIFIENEMKDDKINIDSEFVIEKADVNIINKNEIDCKITMDVISEITKNSNINLINNIEIVENKNETFDYDSLILYIVKDGDTLWDIAKRFKSTIGEILQINKINDENKINIGQKIYIPKFKYVRNLQ